MNTTETNYWEQARIDPSELLPGAGRVPAPGLALGLYELGGPSSHLHGVCHAHKKVWDVQSGGAGMGRRLPTLDELDRRLSRGVD